MKIKIYLSVTLIISFFAINSYGQENPSSKQRLEQKTFYRKNLQVDSIKAEQVADVQDVYKTGLKVVMADTSLSPAARTLKIQILMEKKNQQLRKLLTPVQQEKIIPSSERFVQPLKKD